MVLNKTRNAQIRSHGILFKKADSKKGVYDQLGSNLAKESPNN